MPPERSGGSWMSSSATGMVQFPSVAGRPEIELSQVSITQEGPKGLGAYILRRPPEPLPADPVVVAVRVDQEEASK